MQRSFKNYVERPATLCIPLLLVTFSIGNGARIYAPDFFTVHTDFWLAVYWLLLCGTLIYLLGYGIRATLVLRKDPRSRTIANFYLAASICGILACVVRITTAFVPALQTVGGQHPWCGCSPACAVRASRWRRRIRGASRRSGSPRSDPLGRVIVASPSNRGGTR